MAGGLRPACMHGRGCPSVSESLGKELQSQGVHKLRVHGVFAQRARLRRHVSAAQAQPAHLAVDVGAQGGNDGAELGGGLLCVPGGVGGWGGESGM